MGTYIVGNEHDGEIKFEVGTNKEWIEVSYIKDKKVGHVERYNYNASALQGIAAWFEKFPENSNEETEDLKVEGLDLEFKNAFWSRGEITFATTWSPEGKKIRVGGYEQGGVSNTFRAEQIRELTK